MICPYCRTENRPGAVKCAACGSWMTEPAPVREWVRPRQGRMIAGVCRGLSERFGLPVAAWRVAFLLSLCLWGVALIVYVALWIAMPSAPLPAPIPVQPPAQAPHGNGGGI
ncbi:MAG TPA: PspC domain-containing protein [Anaeromyxobacteraceae bacterium]|jgi:phage shock protein PspC (stress-responsive transcriptional regulator)